VVASSERLTSGGDHLSTDGSGHLCTDDSPEATTALAPSGSPAEATTSATGSLTSGGDHLSMCSKVKRSTPLSPYGGEDMTIQALELGARRKAVLAVWPQPCSRSLSPSQSW
jgi:hypothetical protein